MIEIKNATKKYMMYPAIQNVNVTFNTGKIIGVIGENGSGKTTLLKLLAGLLQPSSGSIIIDSKQVNRKISKKLAYLTDMDYYYPYFTVIELVQYYESQFADFDKEKALEIISFMKLNHAQKIKHLSKGNRNRLKIAVTLGRNAPYIVLDEPFTGLDPMVRKAIMNSIIKFVNLNEQTVIMATHEVSEVEPLLDKVLLLRNGNIIAYESVDDIREEHGMDVTNWMECHYDKMGLL